MFKKHPPVGTLTDADRIDGKVCLVTGANSGLGFAITQQLVERGGKVIMPAVVVFRRQVKRLRL